MTFSVISLTKSILRLRIASIVLLSLTILPFVILSYYSIPAYDDFDYALTTIENGYFQAQKIWYFTWSGRYFSQAVLTTINPLIYYSFAGYKALNVILILLFIFACIYFFKSIFQNEVSAIFALILSLSFTSLYLYKVPNVAFVFYWLSSVIVYTLSNILTLILFAILARKLLWNCKMSQLFFITSTSVLTIAIVGSNEISMLVLIELLLFAQFCHFMATRKWNPHLLWLLVVSLIFSLLVYFAPGNQLRESTVASSPLFYQSVLRSFDDTFRLIINRVLDTPILLFTAILISAYLKYANTSYAANLFSISPFISIPCSFLILSSISFVTYWTLNAGPLDRTLNMVYFYFILFWVYNILVFITYIKRKFKKSEFNAPLPGYAIVIVMILIGSYYLKGNNVLLASKDLIKGRAKNYDKEHLDRFQIIRKCESDTCVVGRIISEEPEFYYPFELSEDASSKYNVILARYYDKPAIIVR